MFSRNWRKIKADRPSQPAIPHPSSGFPNLGLEKRVWSTVKAVLPAWHIIQGTGVLSCFIHGIITIITRRCCFIYGKCWSIMVYLWKSNGKPTLLQFHASLGCLQCGFPYLNSLTFQPPGITWMRSGHGWDWCATSKTYEILQPRWMTQSIL